MTRRTAKKGNPGKKSNVLELLRHRIVEGEYPQGFKLVEQNLAEEFGISRPFIREILSELEMQGLVDKIANRGARVRIVSPDSLIEIMDIREVLEGLAARLAAEKTNRDDWLEIDAAFGESADRLVSQNQFEEYLLLVTRLRDLIMKYADSEELSSLVYALFRKVKIVQKRIVILPGRMRQGVDEHRAVIKALMAGDGPLAEAKKRENIRSAKECLMEYKSWVL